MSLSSRGGARRLQKLPSLKYYYVLKWEIRFTSGLNPAENRHYIKKSSNKICSEISFVQKLSRRVWLSLTGQYQHGIPKNEVNKILPDLG